MSTEAAGTYHARHLLAVSIWDQMQTSDIPPAQEEMAKWEAEYNQLMHSSVEDWDYDYGSTFTEAYKNGLGEEKSKLNDDGLPILGSYVFGERALFQVDI